MPVFDLHSLASVPRLLLEAHLAPIQGDRFQPAGFPDLGPATYTLPDGTDMLLVESTQSMANLAEAACWDESQSTLVSVLAGLPYVHVDVVDGETVLTTTASVLEAHRLNSPYVLQGMIDDRTFQDLLLEQAEYHAGRPVDRERFLGAVLKFDPACLLHGLFMSYVEDARMRLPRAMSAFVEARDVRVAQSGGVKNDRINPSGKTEEGFGNVPFARTEFTAGSITAFFNLDLRQLWAYGLPREAAELLELLALYKFFKLTRDGLRRRTACDLETKGVTVRAPEGLALPPFEVLEQMLPAAIAACKPYFADPPVTRLRFQQTAASAKSSKKATRAAKETAS
ncbi:MAG: type I-U CRISPR-associated protein Cas7 [Acidobacteria bacterium]|nr:type I-U CRISPR-associated protein Cas7 [Acidobacteriota bacterium]